MSSTKDPTTNKRWRVPAREEARIVGRFAEGWSKKTRAAKRHWALLAWLEGGRVDHRGAGQRGGRSEPQPEASAPVGGGEIPDWNCPNEQQKSADGTKAKRS